MGNEEIIEARQLFWSIYQKLEEYECIQKFEESCICVIQNHLKRISYYRKPYKILMQIRLGVLKTLIFIIKSLFAFQKVDLRDPQLLANLKNEIR